MPMLIFFLCRKPMGEVNEEDEFSRCGEETFQYIFSLGKKKIVGFVVDDDVATIENGRS